MTGDKNNVAIVSCVRDTSPYLKAFLNQLDSLDESASTVSSIILVTESTADGRDSVIRRAKERDNRITTITEIASDAKTESIEQKAWQWATIANQGIEAALDARSEFILWVESDLSFPLDLVNRLVRCDQDIVAPVVMLGADFYDSWGFRTLRGEKIFDLSHLRGEGRSGARNLIELSSVGSCVLFRSDIFRSGVRFRGPYETGLLVGVCHDAKELGYRVWVDSTTAVIHPTTLWERQIWTIEKIDVVTNPGEIQISQSVNIPVASRYPDLILRSLKEYGHLTITDSELENFEVIVEPDDSRRTIQLTFALK